MSCRSTTTIFKDLKFEDPIRTDLQGRHYYTQALKHEQGNICLMTDWFESGGARMFDKKLQMNVTFTKENLELIKYLEDFAINRGLKLPVEYQINVPIEHVFKRLPLNKPNLIVKIDFDGVCFDKTCSQMQLLPELFGDYRVIVQVKGLYIGPHSNDKLVSLQLRIVQLQFVPKKRACMFSFASSLTFGNLPNAMTSPALVNSQVPQTPQPASEVTAPLAANKKGRKPKLQRQNAVVEQQVHPAEHHALESMPPDFFTDISELAAFTGN